MKSIVPLAIAAVVGAAAHHLLEEPLKALGAKLRNKLAPKAPEPPKDKP